jgi:surfactin synthase thioesterase subunit
MTAKSMPDEKWLRRYHDDRPDGSLRLVCFPYAGGSASYFLRLSKELASSMEVLAVQYPGRQDRRLEPPLTSLPDLADQAYQAVRTLDDRPTAFFGHSMGSIVAFEVARRMEAEGRGPVRLFASARRSPTASYPESVHTLDDAGLVAELRRLSGTDQMFLDDPDLLALILPALRADYTAIETHWADPGSTVHCPISALVGDEDPRASVEEMRSWERHTTEAFDLTVFPGGHFYLTDQVAQVATLIGDRLAKYGG